MRRDGLWGPQHCPNRGRNRQHRPCVLESSIRLQAPTGRAWLERVGTRLHPTTFLPIIVNGSLLGAHDENMFGPRRSADPCGAMTVMANLIVPIDRDHELMMLETTCAAIKSIMAAQREPLVESPAEEECAADLKWWVCHDAPCRQPCTSRGRALARQERVASH